MSEFNFKSQPCTSREQSERLLVLGLKKETADCYYWQECDQYGDPNGKWHLDILNDDTREHFEYLLNHFGICLHIEDALFIPAWSLHRLLCLYGLDYTIKEVYNNAEECYGMLICAIEIAIEEGDFNKEYLENEMEEKA